jgi:hypothetical protein
MQIGIGIGVPGPSAAAASFNPASLFTSGEKGFVYDFSSAANLYQDSAGTTAVTTTGDPIGKVLDLSGNANHATQPSGGAARPTWRATYAEFNGTGNSLVTPAINMTGTDTITVVLGMRNVDGATTAVFVESSADSTANNGAIFDGFLTSVAAMFSKGAAGLVNVQLGNGVTGLITGRDLVKRVKYTTLGTTAAEQVLPKINGITRTVNVSGTADLTGNFGNHVWNIGRRNNASLPMEGYLYAAAVISRALTEAEEQSLGSWIGSRLPRVVAVACVGNSMTEGSALPSPATQCWPAVMQASLGSGYRVDNWGHSAMTTPQLKALLPTEGMMSGDRYRPSVLILWEGHNDMAPAGGNQTPAQAYQHYVDFLDDARSQGWNGPILVATSPPSSTISPANFATFNALIYANAIADGFDGIVDLAPVASLDPPSIDGIHQGIAQNVTIASYMQAGVVAVA